MNDITNKEENYEISEVSEAREKEIKKTQHLAASFILSILSFIFVLAAIIIYWAGMAAGDYVSMFAVLVSVPLYTTSIILNIISTIIIKKKKVILWKGIKIWRIIIWCLIAFMPAGPLLTYFIALFLIIPIGLIFALRVIYEGSPHRRRNIFLITSCVVLVFIAFAVGNIGGVLDDFYYICAYPDHPDPELAHFVIGLFIQQGNLEQQLQCCLRIRNEWRRARCQADLITRMAIEEKDPSLCEKIESEWGRDWCYRDVAIETQNASFCKKIIDGRIRDGCYQGISN